MSCEGYEHGSVVVLTASLPDVPVLIGTRGLVVEIYRDLHELDVEFEFYGLWKGLDAHSFQPLSGGEGHGNSNIGGMEMG